MRYAVTSCSLDLTNFGNPTINKRTPAPGVIGTTRTEVIDTETNELFTDCLGEWEITDRYEAFWNRLNALSEKRVGNCHNRTARVVVLNVEIVQ